MTPLRGNAVLQCLRLLVALPQAKDLLDGAKDLLLGANRKKTVDFEGVGGAQEKGRASIPEHKWSLRETPVGTLLGRRRWRGR
jgi:hypothetical protein